MLPVLETMNTRTISLLTTDIKTRKLISVKKEIMEEALKNLNIGSKILIRRSRTMRDIVLVIENAAKALAGSIMTTKSVRLQTEYLRTRKTKGILHEVPLYISGDH